MRDASPGRPTALMSSATLDASKSPGSAGYATAAASGAIGKYGRCGRIIMRAFFGIVMLPSPKGQTPAMARNKVDLPAPEGPLTSTRSPSLIVTSVAVIIDTPLHRR